MLRLRYSVTSNFSDEVSGIGIAAIVFLCCVIGCISIVLDGRNEICWAVASDLDSDAVPALHCETKWKDVYDIVWHVSIAIIAWERVISFAVISVLKIWDKRPEHAYYSEPYLCSGEEKSQGAYAPQP